MALARRHQRPLETPLIMSGERGFTLLEVLVAVAILGLGLTVILSAQAGAVRRSSHARYMSVAVSLARCKMTELEEELWRDGYKELAVKDDGPCCNGDESPNMRCSWTIEKPTLPEADSAELNLDTEMGGLGGLGVLAKARMGEPTFNPADGISGVVDALQGDSEDPAGGITNLVMGMVYPDLKQIIESSSRRVTVTLTWLEGNQPYDIAIVQWVTDPKQAGLVGRVKGDAIDQAENAADQAAGNSNSPSSPTTPTGTPQR